MKIYQRILEILDTKPNLGRELLPVIFNGAGEPRLIGHATNPERVDAMLIARGLKATYISLATIRDDDRQFFICYG